MTYFIYSTWGERPLLNSSLVKSQIFTLNRTDNCFTMKELHLELFLRIPPSVSFWKYPTEQKKVQSQRQKNTGTGSVNVIRVSL